MQFLKKLFAGRPPAPPGGLLDVAALAEAYAASVRAAHPGMQVEVGHGAEAATTRVHWTFPDGLAVNQFMGNLYTRYLQQPQNLQTLFAAQLAIAHGVQQRVDHEPAGPATARILPVVKTTGWQRSTAAQLEASEVPADRRPLVVPLVGPLVLAYVEDLPDAMDYVSPHRLQALGLEQAELHALALRNLEEQLLPQLDVQGGRGRYAARLDHNYDASMVLLFDRWRDRIAVEGEPVIAIAARDDLLLCGSGDTATVAGLRGMATDILAQSAYGLTDQLFVWRGGRLQEYPQA